MEPRIFWAPCAYPDVAFDIIPSMIRRRRVLAILTITASVMLAVGVAEGLVRIFWTPPSLRTTIAFHPHPYYGWAPLPGLQGTRVSAEFEHQVTHSSFEKIRFTVNFAGSLGIFKNLFDFMPVIKQHIKVAFEKYSFSSLTNCTANYSHAFRNVKTGNNFFQSTAF